RGVTGRYFWRGSPPPPERVRNGRRAVVPFEAMASADQIRLLLVEDVPQVAQYVRGLLNAQTQVRLVDVISDGGKALSLLTDQRPDVILVDALLQGRVRGMALVRELKASGLGIPVIVLTVPQHPVTASLDDGVDEVLQMPFNGYDLISKVVA